MFVSVAAALIRPTQVFAGRLCESRVAASGMGLFAAGRFRVRPPVSRPFIFAAGSSFVFRSVAAGVVVCPRSGSRRA